MSSILVHCSKYLLSHSNSQLQATWEDRIWVYPRVLRGVNTEKRVKLGGMLKGPSPFKTSRKWPKNLLHKSLGVQFDGDFRSSQLLLGIMFINHQQGHMLLLGSWGREFHIVLALQLWRETTSDLTTSSL